MQSCRARYILTTGFILAILGSPGCSHAVHLIMNINLTAVGRAFWAGAALVEGVRFLDDLESAGFKNNMSTVYADYDRVLIPYQDWEDLHSHRVCRQVARAHSPLEELVRVCHESRCSPDRAFFIYLFSGPTGGGDICSWTQSHSINIGFLKSCLLRWTLKTIQRGTWKTLELYTDFLVWPSSDS